MMADVSLCVCGLLLAVLSANASDLDTTRQMTAKGVEEINPLARPFVEGPGARGELTLWAVSTVAYAGLSQTSEPWASQVLFMAWMVHTSMALRNDRRLNSVSEVQQIIAPIFMVQW